MSQVMPQEVEVWYLIPALRREITKFLMKNHDYNQKDIANVLGMTESAVSQYLSGKRGQGIKFNEKELKLIESASEKIAKNNSEGVEILYKLSKKIMGSKSICDLHKKQDSSIPKNCDICIRK